MRLFLGIWVKEPDHDLSGNLAPVFPVVFENGELRADPRCYPWIAREEHQCKAPHDE